MQSFDAAPSAELDGESFRAIAELAYAESGLTLVEEKTTMIQSRLRHRLRALGLDAFSQYCAYVRSDEGQQERRFLISALTTNVSHFFREAHHYDFLNETLTARYANSKTSPPLRIWSAGCSKGQEALSIAMSMMENHPQRAEGDFRILATDIDPVVVQFAQHGRYPEKMTKGASPALRNKYFDETEPEGGEPTYTATRKIRDLIRYNELNLLASWPIKTKFDAIFCRNVVIYFDAETQDRLWPRFRAAMQPDGLLFLGHSERIATPEKFGFECIAPTTYRPLPT